MLVRTNRVTTIELSRDEAVQLRRVLDTAAFPAYDTEGRELAKRIVDAMSQQLYYGQEVN